MPREGRRVKLSDQIRLHLDWWAKFNGKARMVVRAGKVNHVYTDASMYGFGGHWECDLHDEWGSHINVRELWPVVVALQRWCEYRDGVLVVITDNTQVEAMLNTERSINPYCMAWLWEIFWVSVLYNIHVRAKRIASSDNILADAPPP